MAYRLKIIPLSSPLRAPRALREDKKNRRLKLTADYLQTKTYTYNLKQTRRSNQWVS